MTCSETSTGEKRRRYQSWRQGPEIYGNIALLKVDNESGEVFPLARISERHATFYLRRGLAQRVRWEPRSVDERIQKDQIVPDPGGRGILLNFTPRGNGHLESVNSDFWLDERPSICCVCGKTTELTLHHLVPLRNRRWLPLPVKSHNCHDVLSLCVGCHELAEKANAGLEERLIAQFSENNPLRDEVMASGRGHTVDDRPSVVVLDEARAMKYATTLTRKQAATIPAARKAEMIRAVADSSLAQDSDTLLTLADRVEAGDCADAEVGEAMAAVVDKGLPLHPICNSVGYEMVLFLLNSPEVARAARRLDEGDLLKRAIKARCMDAEWREKADRLVQEYEMSREEDEQLMSQFCRPGDEICFTHAIYGRITDFFCQWRQVFIDYCKPRYLPNGWRVDAPILPDNAVLRALESAGENEFIYVTCNGEMITSSDGSTGSGTG